MLHLLRHLTVPGPRLPLLPLFRLSSSSSSSEDIAKRVRDLLLIMPKEETHLPALRLKRMEKRNKRADFQPATIFWQVLGPGSPGAPSSLFLYTDHSRYIFNCGEGSQRMTSQMSLPRALAQLEHVFITNKSWRNMGGLPGLCLSVRGAGGADITIHGPPGCMDIYDATKNFVLLLEFDVHTFSSSDGVFCDGAVRIDEIKLKSSKSSLPSTPRYDTWGLDPETFQPYENSVQAYICSFNPKPGKLDVEKCLDFGVPAGPLLGKLKSGQDVTLEDGRVVKSADVVADMAPPTSYIVIEIPDRDYLAALSASNKLRKVNNLQVVFHFSPPELLQEPEYIAWMQNFPPPVKHVFINKNSCGMGLVDVSGYHARLRLIQPDFFPALSDAGSDPVPGFSVETELCSKLAGLDLIQAKAGLKVHVRPDNIEQKVELEPHMMYKEQEIIDEALKGSAIQDEEERRAYVAALELELKQAQQHSQHNGQIPESSHCDNNNTKCSYPVVTFLGTGSSIPSKYRNVSCILLQIQEERYMMMDCGEGSLSQLFRLHAPLKAQQILRQLKAVYISHQHADHHLGIINIILARAEAFQAVGQTPDKLFIIATGRYSEFLARYHERLEPVVSDAVLIKSEHLLLYEERDEYGENIPGTRIQLLYADTLKELCDTIGLSEIATCKAVHCPHAFCLSIRTSEGYKVVYTGDTRPCDALQALGSDTSPPDLLIHEATMEHYMLYDAIIKKHSTFAEAIKSGEDMGAKFTLLTHFSQRYAKIPALGEIEGKKGVGIAFDNMVVRPDNLNTISSMFPALKRIFWESVQEMEEKRTVYVYKYSPEDCGPDEDMEEFNDKKSLVNELNQKFEKKQNFFKEVNKRKQRQRQELKDEEAKRFKKTDIL